MWGKNITKDGGKQLTKKRGSWLNPRGLCKEEKTKDLGQSRDSRNPRHSIGATKETTVSQFLTIEVFFFFFFSKLMIYLKICIIVGNNSFLQLFYSAF